MIEYLNILEKLKNAGYSSTYLKDNHILSAVTLQNIRSNKPVKLESIDKICELLDCKLEDIIRYKPR